MNRRQSRAALGLALGLGIAPGIATATPSLRLQVDQHGDMILIGNTLGQDCAAATPAPLAGMVGACGSTGIDDSAPDVFWRSDEPSPGQALASSALTAAEARSSAVLSLPPGATVTHALLYWGARSAQATGDIQATIEREGVFTRAVAAIAFNTATVGTLHFYQSVADVSDVVAMYGSGSYRIANVDMSNLVDVNLNSSYAGWWLVVLYDLPTDPFRNLAIFDGLDTVNDMSPELATLSGFFVPGSGYDAKLGVVAYDGDASVSGDRLLVNANVISNAENPATNFFNSTRTLLGAPVSASGDLPQLNGKAYSMSGLDYDVISIVPQLQPGDSSVTVQATATGDQFFLGAFITSISTLAPDFGHSPKTAVDLNGGSLTPGDIVEYAIAVTNTGNDDSTGTILTDALAAGMTYVPGSIQITAGPNSGGKTDAFSDDQADYDSVSRTLIVRLGQGADAGQGGSLLVGASTTVVFRAAVDLGVSGIISNQAKITAGGMQGAPPLEDWTDGNGSGLGAPPTDIAVDSDGDGLFDDLEDKIGTNPDDADSDNDGVLDGAEPGYGGDTDGDGLVNALDSDSDNDGLFDGTELGLDCSNPDTDTSRGECRADADGTTKTDPLVADTDGGGASDGKEDANKNGAIDPGETDPNDPSDDGAGGCQSDSECGAATSGKVCHDVTKTCVDGCRDPGRACPDDKVCTASGGFSGVCVNNLNLSQDSGCQCATPPEESSGLGGWLGFVAAGVMAGMRRRRRSPSRSLGQSDGLSPTCCPSRMRRPPRGCGRRA